MIQEVISNLITLAIVGLVVGFLIWNYVERRSIEQKKKDLDAIDHDALTKPLSELVAESNKAWARRDNSKPK